MRRRGLGRKSVRCNTAHSVRGDRAVPKRTPSYRQRTGYHQAIVTLSDVVTRKRRDDWLGEYNSPASRERYHRLIAARH